MFCSRPSVCSRALWQPAECCCLIRLVALASITDEVKLVWDAGRVIVMPGRSDRSAPRVQRDMVFVDGEFYFGVFRLDDSGTGSGYWTQRLLGKKIEPQKAFAARCMPTEFSDADEMVPVSALATTKYEL